MINPTDRELIRQTKKWLSKLEKERKKIKVRKQSKRVKDSLKNLDAYISDAFHFLKEGDNIRAFEAVIYAWGILDTLRKCHLIIEKGST